jgi:hypothetical protein
MRVAGRKSRESCKIRSEMRKNDIASIIFLKNSVNSLTIAENELNYAFPDHRSGGTTHKIE